MNRFILLLLILNTSFAFGQKTHQSIKIVKQKHILDLPSASGVEYLDGNIYIIGDDSPYLFKLDDDFEILEKYSLTNNDSTINGRVIKGIKSDFEAMAFFDKEHLIVLSSGSKLLNRDTLHLFSLKTKSTIVSKSMRPIYDELNKNLGLEVNMEAISITSKKVIIMQRGNNNENLIIQFKKNDFFNYLISDESDIPKYIIYKFLLPTKDNIMSGFSGSCIIQEKKGLLFTASLEATVDAYSDGEIMGSYIGFISFKDFRNNELKTEILSKNNESLKTKLEGITIKSYSDTKTSLFVVSDNDDGTSWVYELEVNNKLFFNNN